MQGRLQTPDSKYPRSALETYGKNTTNRPISRVADWGQEMANLPECASQLKHSAKLPYERAATDPGPALLRPLTEWQRIKSLDSRVVRTAPAPAWPANISNAPGLPADWGVVVCAATYREISPRPGGLPMGHLVALKARHRSDCRDSAKMPIALLPRHARLRPIIASYEDCRWTRLLGQWLLWPLLASRSF